MPQSFTKNNATRVILIGTILVILAVLAGFAWKSGWLGTLGSQEPKYETPSFSADYLPSDTEAVLYVNLRETQDSKYVKKELGPALTLIRNTFAPRDMQEALGIDAAQDVDWVQIMVNSADPDRPLVLLGGSFDPAKFKTTPKGLRQVNKPGDRYRLYEFPQPSPEPAFTLAPGEKTLLLSTKPTKVTDALADAAAGRMPVLQDMLLADILKKVDRNQSIWGAAAMKQSKPIMKVSVLVDGLLQQIVQASDAVYGGVKCADEVRGVVYFVTSSETNAQEVDEKLRALCFAARLGAGAMPKEYQPLGRLLGKGDVSREGNTVILRCGLP